MSAIQPANLHDWISLRVLRAAKLGRVKFTGSTSEFYDSFFTADDTVACAADLRRIVRDEEVYRAIAALPIGAIIVDVGCGLGDVIGRAPGHHRRVALEFSLTTLAAARQRVADVSFVGGSALMLPLRDKSVDAVICLEVLEHLAEDGAAMAEIARILKPGGILVASVPSARYFDDYLALMGHFRHYTPDSFRAALSRVGIAVREDLCTYPRLNRVSFYAYCALWMCSRLARVVSRGVTPYTVRLPFCRPALYEQMTPALLAIAGRDRNATRVPDTFVKGVRTA